MTYLTAATVANLSHLLIQLIGLSSLHHRFGSSVIFRSGENRLNFPIDRISNVNFGGKQV
jgi:hypothetical protein